MDDWGDGKRFLFEDIITYATILVVDLGFDCFYNLGHAIGICHDFRVVSIGSLQIGIAFVFSLLLVRKLDQWRYYS